MFWELFKYSILIRKRIGYFLSLAVRVHMGERPSEIPEEGSHLSAMTES